jgi:hypothetical protein
MRGRVNFYATATCRGIRRSAWTIHHRIGLHIHHGFQTWSGFGLLYVCHTALSLGFARQGPKHFAISFFLLVETVKLHRIKDFCCVYVVGFIGF